MTTRTIHVHYFKAVPNFGDLLNKWLIESLFGVQVRWCSPERQRVSRHLLGVGSMLYYATANSVVWGTGLLTASAIPQELPLQVSALRGALSAREMRRAGVAVPEVFGDPGLLVSRLISQPRNDTGPRYKIGLVPHYVDQHHPVVRSAACNPDIRIIDVRQPPQVVCSAIAQCAAIVSSSLHGIIAADSFAIPSLWVTLSDGVEGGGFKFRDHFTVAKRKRQQPIEMDGAFDEGIVTHCEVGQVHADVAERLIGAFPLALV